MDSFWQAVTEHNWEQPEVKIEFRLYYDEHGNVISYSMEDLPGNYIAIDRVTFEQTRFDIKVKDILAGLEQSSEIDDLVEA
jgi:hypothetical protein